MPPGPPPQGTLKPTQVTTVRLNLNHPALIGMIHLPPLPGAPGYQGDLEAVVEGARASARLLHSVGFDALMVENFHDTPFFKDELPPETIAALTRCALAIRQETPKPLGINALRNAGRAALGIAVAVGAQFIRVNVLTGAMLTDQGIIEGRAAQLLRARQALGARHIQIFADVCVKHAAPLAPCDLVQLAKDTLYRGHADALILSGAGTGAPTDPAEVEALRAAVDAPLLIGSGVTVETMPHLKAEGYIVGTALKREGRLDEGAARQIIAARDQLRGGPRI
ncbi:BtpA/SgcQ family protein [Myxococcota bacterium]|nr:BtpA/SgcQ family protein [Myxococcota bacterium]MBU1431223.1 BtpA/SgcQ family protein [Myxococcota bacterium]MBU1896974.1 BtpA/SgcQ family protein [Myxococcota bacterium]